MSHITEWSRHGNGLIAKRSTCINGAKSWRFARSRHANHGFSPEMTPLPTAASVVRGPAETPCAVGLLAHSADAFTEKCVNGIIANRERCKELVELSMAMVTSLAPKIGYDRAAEIAKESAKTGRTVREIACDKRILPEDELKRALDPIKMTEPGGTGGE